jgi:hypothetical protein
MNSFLVLIKLYLVNGANFDTKFVHARLASPSGSSSDLLVMTSPRHTSLSLLMRNSEKAKLFLLTIFYVNFILFVALSQFQSTGFNIL